MNLSKKSLSILCFSLASAAALAGYTIRAARADGVPSAGALTYSGTLEDVAGKPVSDSKLISVALWDKATAGTGNRVCESPVASVGVNNGRFDVKLPDDCATAAKDNPNLWIEVTVEGELLGRVKLGAVPYALEAGAASEAKGGLKTDVDGLKAQASEWTSYDSVVSVNVASPPNLGKGSGKWRRVGDSIEIMVVFSGPISMKLSGTQPLTFSLPAGAVVDHAKLPAGGGISIGPCFLYYTNTGGAAVGSVGTAYYETGIVPQRITLMTGGTTYYRVSGISPVDAGTVPFSVDFRATLPLSAFPN